MIGIYKNVIVSHWPKMGRRELMTHPERNGGFVDFDSVYCSS